MIQFYWTSCIAWAIVLFSCDITGNVDLADTDGFVFKRFNEAGRLSLMCDFSLVPGDINKMMSISLERHAIGQGEKTHVIASLFPYGKSMFLLKSVFCISFQIIAKRINK